MGLVLRRKPEHETLRFSCKVAASGDEGYLLYAAVAVWIVSRSIGSSSVFCNAGMRIVLRWLHGCVRGAAKRIVLIT